MLLYPITQSEFLYCPEWGVLWVAPGHSTANPDAEGGAYTGWLWVQLEAWFWSPGWRWDTGFPLACTQYSALEPDPRLLGPSRLVKNPGVGAHSGGTTPCILLVGSQEVLHHVLQGLVVVPTGLWLASRIL